METFKYIRNRISEHSKASLLEIAFRVLKKEEANPSQSFPLFSILTLIKWTLLYGGEKYPPKTADGKIFDNLIVLISDLQTFSQFMDITKEKNLNKVLTVAAHQQFWLQDQVTMAVIWRQIVLYISITSKYNVNEAFKAKTGLDIIDFFKIAFIIYVHLNSDKVSKEVKYLGFISPDWINTIDTKISIASRVKFFQLLTFGTGESVRRLKKDSEKIRNFELRTYDTHFFSQYPIFYFNSYFFVPHKAIFPNTIRHYIYDFLKEADISFPEDFGKRMEQYIYWGIKEMGINCITENQFKTIHKKCNNQVDFIISDNILIESKAIELNTLPSVLPNDDILFRSLKDSVVKAYVNQMLPVANYLNPLSEYFGIIITYKKLHLGPVLECWDTLLKNNTEEFCTKNNLKHNILPPENLFFIDIDTWDLMVQIIVDKRSSLKELLTHFRKQDSHPNTRKHEIKMHLEHFFPISVNLRFHKEAEKLFAFEK